MANSQYIPIHDPLSALYVKLYRNKTIRKRLMDIGVLGAGTWGMALARSLSNIGHDVTVWSAIEQEIDDLSASKIHPNLPGVKIPEAIVFTKDIRSAVTAKDILLFAVPSSFVRATSKKAAEFIKPGQLIADVAKGIESDSLMTMSEIIDDEIKGARVVALSGPTHAEEVSRDIPTTIVSAAKNIEDAEYIKEAFHSDTLSVYTSSDIKGVELSGALKNIIALATGIAAGLNYGDNTRAALITLGLQEIKDLGLKMGCSADTFYGLAGIGDLIVTATSIHSRNNRCGNLIGQGINPQEAIAQVGMVVEGISALPAAIGLSDKYSVDMPIVRAVNDIVNNGADPKTVLRFGG